MSVFPVTWQRWRSHHSIRCSRIPHAARKRHGSIFCIEPHCYCRLKLYIAGIGNFAVFAPVTLTLTRWPSYTNLTRIPSKYPRRPKMNFLRQGFQKLSSDRYTYRQTDRRSRNYTPHRFAGSQLYKFLSHHLGYCVAQIFVFKRRYIIEQLWNVIFFVASQ